MLDATYGWAVGQSGALMQWDGANWTTFTGPSGAAYLDTVKVVSRTDAWAAGSTNISNANLWHWNGTSWKGSAHPQRSPFARPPHDVGHGCRAVG